MEKAEEMMLLKQAYENKGLTNVTVSQTVEDIRNDNDEFRDYDVFGIVPGIVDSIDIEGIIE